MASTYVLISSNTVGSGGAATVDFTSIPSTYTDLVLRFSGRSDTGGIYNDVKIKFNNDTTSANLWNAIYTIDGSTLNQTSGNTNIYGNVVSPGATSSVFGNVEVYISNYANSSIYKIINIDAVTENNATAAGVTLQGQTWESTAAINSISLYCSSGNFDVGSTFYLYGISNS